MKSVLLIAIVAVAMIGVMVPSVTADSTNESSPNESKLTKLKLESIKSTLIQSNNSHILIAKTIASNEGDKIIYGYYVPYLFTENSMYEQKKGYDVYEYGIESNLCDTVNPDIYPGTKVELNTCFILPSDDLSNFSLRIFEHSKIDSVVDRIFKNSSEKISLKIPTMVYGIAPFVDQTKDPQHYVDRYNNEPTYKEWFDENYSQYSSIYEAVGLEEPEFGICGDGTKLINGVCTIIQKMIEKPWWQFW